jgi:hypothetical protein
MRSTKAPEFRYRKLSSPGIKHLQRVEGEKQRNSFENSQVVVGRGAERLYSRQAASLVARR